MPDNVVQVEIQATDTSAQAAFDATATSVEQLIAAVRLTDGDLNLFRSVLEADAKAGIDVSDSLKTLAVSAGTVGKNVASASEALLLERNAAMEAAAALAAKTAATQATATASLEAAAALGATESALAAEATAAVAAAEATAGIAPAALSAAASFSEMTAAATATALGVKENMFAASQSVGQFATQAKISSAGVSSAFNLMGAALGGSILAGFLLETLNKYKDHELALHRLSEATGVEVKALSEFHAALQDEAIATEKGDAALTRLSIAMNRAASGSKEAIASFNALGVSTKSWGDEMPPTLDVLMKMADGMQSSDDKTKTLGASMRLMGRGARDMAGFMREGSDEIRRHMEMAAGMAQADADAMQSARQLALAEAQLSHALQELAGSVFPTVVQGLLQMMKGFLIAALGIDTVGRIGIQAAKDLLLASKIMKDIGTGQVVTGLMELQARSKDTANTWTATFEKIKSDGISLHDLFSRMTAAPKITPPTGPGIEVDDNADKINRAALARIDAAERHAKAEFDLERSATVARIDLAKEADEARAKLLTTSSQREMAMAAAGEKAEREKAEALDLLYARENEKLKSYLEQKAAIYAADPQGKSEAKEEETKGKIQELNDKFTSEQQKNAQELAKAVQRSSEQQTEARIKALDESAIEGLKEYDARQDALNKQYKAAEEYWKKYDEATHKAFEKELADSQKQQNTLLEMERARIKALPTAERTPLGAATAGPGAMTDVQKLAAEQATYDKEYEMQAANLEKRYQESLKFGDKTIEEQEKIVGEMQAVWDKAAKQQQATTIATAAIIRGEYEKIASSLSNAMAPAIGAMLRGQQTILGGFTQMSAAILTNWTNSLAQMLSKYLAHIALRFAAEHGLVAVLNVLHLTDAANAVEAEVVKTAAVKAGAAATEGVGAVQATKDIIRLAGKTFAAAFASTAEIPIVGPALAPGVAAGSAAAALSGALGFAEQGALLPSDMPIFAHAGEMILPKHLSQGMQDMVADGGGGGQSVTLHYYAPQNHTPQQLYDNANVVLRIVKDGLKHGELR